MADHSAVVKLRHNNAETAYLDIVRVDGASETRIPMSWDEFDERVADQALQTHGWRRLGPWSADPEHARADVTEA